MTIRRKGVARYLRGSSRITTMPTSNTTSANEVIVVSAAPPPKRYLSGSTQHTSEIADNHIDLEFLPHRNALVRRDAA